jgi:iron complex outermembrane receptor protein
MHGGSQVQLFISGRNLTDDEQRYHTSFIKDLAPQPGRTIEAGLQMLF